MLYPDSKPLLTRLLRKLGWKDRSPAPRLLLPHRGSPVLVVGATGGVGQLVVAELLRQGYRVRVLVRDPEKAARLFGSEVQVAIGDTLNPQSLVPALKTMEAVICATGTTAFPSARWQFQVPENLTKNQRWQTWWKIYTDAAYREQVANNSPQRVDRQGVQNLVAALPKTVKRLVLVSSCGIERKDQFPFRILNLFGVLDAKEAGEAVVKSGEVPYTIVRPGRLIDGPFTSLDLNTLMEASTEGKWDVVLGRGDRLSGQASRGDVARACVAALASPVTENQVFELINRGKRPETIDWQARFEALFSEALFSEALFSNSRAPRKIQVFATMPTQSQDFGAGGEATRPN